MSTTDIDAELAADNQKQEYEKVTLYLMGPKFGMDFIAGNKRSPIAVFNKGQITLDRSPENVGLIRALIRQYACTTDREKAIVSQTPRDQVLKGGKPAFGKEENPELEVAKPAPAKTESETAKTDPFEKKAE